MSSRTEIYDHVIADAGITALIGTRLFWLQLPEAVAYPAVRYEIINKAPNTAHDGQYGVETIVVQFDVLALDDGEVEAVAQAFKTSLNGVKTATISAYQTDERDAYLQEGNQWMIQLDFLMHIR